MCVSVVFSSPQPITTTIIEYDDAPPAGGGGDDDDVVGPLHNDTLITACVKYKFLPAPLPCALSYPRSL